MNDRVHLPLDSSASPARLGSEQLSNDVDFALWGGAVSRSGTIQPTDLMNRASTVSVQDQSRTPSVLDITPCPYSNNTSSGAVEQNSLQPAGPGGDLVALANASRPGDRSYDGDVRRMADLIWNHYASHQSSPNDTARQGQEIRQMMTDWARDLSGQQLAQLVRDISNRLGSRRNYAWVAIENGRLNLWHRLERDPEISIPIPPRQG
jgi:hypothetical protein